MYSFTFTTTTSYHHHIFSVFPPPPPPPPPPATHFNCFPFTTTTTSLFSLHHPHQEHTSIVSLNHHHHPCVMFCIDCHHHHNDNNNNNNTLQFFSLHHHPFVLCCFPQSATTTTTTTSFLLFSLHRHRHHHHDHISTGFPPSPTTHYLPHIDSLLAVHRLPHQPYIDPCQHGSKNKKRRRRGNITESNRINHFSSRFGVLMIKRYFPATWYFLFAAHRFVLQTHRHQLCYKTLAAAHWLFTRLWTLGSQNMEVLQKSVY